MPSLSELRKQIKGVGSTRKITKAMKMVAGARLNKAIALMQSSGTFFKEINDISFQMFTTLDISLNSLLFTSTPISPHNLSQKNALVIVSSDKGLCGDFNTSIFKEAEKLLFAKSDLFPVLFTIGKKACDYFRKKSAIRIIEFPNVFSNLDFRAADKLGSELIKQFNEQKLSGITCISTKFQSMIKKAITINHLLPIKIDDKLPTLDLEFEPDDSNEFLEKLIPLYLKANIYAILCESFATELSTRMRAMDNATKNAGMLTDRITLEMNKVRQSTITREIAEIIGTNEVIQ
jgi:F-type H+-transporting ATPase subunit gamma